MAGKIYLFYCTRNTKKAYIQPKSMAENEYEVYRNSPLVGMALEDIKKKYGVNILSWYMSRYDHPPEISCLLPHPRFEVRRDYVTGGRHLKLHVSGTDKALSAFEVVAQPQ